MAQTLDDLIFGAQSPPEAAETLLRERLADKKRAYASTVREKSAAQLAREGKAAEKLAKREAVLRRMLLERVGVGVGVEMNVTCKATKELDVNVKTKTKIDVQAHQPVPAATKTSPRAGVETKNQRLLNIPDHHSPVPEKPRKTSKVVDKMASKRDRTDSPEPTSAAKRRRQQSPVKVPSNKDFRGMRSGGRRGAVSGETPETKTETEKVDTAGARKRKRSDSSPTDAESAKRRFAETPGSAGKRKRSASPTTGGCCNPKRRFAETPLLPTPAATLAGAGAESPRPKRLREPDHDAEVPVAKRRFGESGSEEVNAPTEAEPNTEETRSDEAPTEGHRVPAS